MPTQYLLRLFCFVDVDAEKRVDESLVQTWKLKFGHKVIFCSEFQHKGGVQIIIIKMEI